MLTIRLSVEATAFLDELVNTGFYGLDAQAAADQILNDGLRRIAEKRDRQKHIDRARAARRGTDF